MPQAILATRSAVWLAEGLSRGGDRVGCTACDSDTDGRYRHWL